MRRLLAALLAALTLATVTASPASAEVHLASQRIVLQPDAWGGQTMTVMLEATCDDGFPYVRVELRQRNKTSTGFGGYVLTYNSGEVPCDGVSHPLSVDLWDNRFRPGPAELKVERITPEGTDTTGWVTVKLAKR